VAKIVAIDFETANERRSSPCAVGLAWIEGGAVSRREYRLIRPRDLRFSPFNIRVHGLTAEDVRGAPEFPEAMAEFLPEIAGAIVLAHNASFDVGVLRETLLEYGQPVPAFSSLCTVQVARATWPDMPSFKLNAVAERLDLRFRHHHAGDDAAACARIALAAARRAGADCVSELPARLGVALGGGEARHAAGTRPGPRGAGPVRRTPAPAAAGRGDVDLRFRVSGSAGNEYVVSARQALGRIDLACECSGWRMRRWCRHVTALADGEVEMLRSGNAADLPAFAALVARFRRASPMPRAGF
jgi:DNA polymerase-3 subunit epsilon